jgi:hypothetical protein
MKLRLAVIVAVALAACAVAPGYQDDSAAPRDVGDTQISPDGNSVLFTRAGAIWHIPYSGGDEQRISDVFAGTGPPLAGGRPDVGAPRPVHRLTFSDR